MTTEPATDPGALRRAVHDEAVSTAGAWSGGQGPVEGFLRRVVADLNRLPRLIVHHAEFGHYGSGYASYTDVFLTKRDGSMRRAANDWTEVEGVSLALCRLAPFAVLLTPSRRSSGPDGAGTYSLPELSRVADTDPPGWEQECRQVHQVLDRHGVVLLGSPVLGLPLDEGLHVETILGDPPYTVFDAWFHWMD
ncbi:hypothetical protein Ssi03_32750 [Sphaerisporangium siamense]|uniref:Uncharacterized protein n=1 Tax=Sphaerisporangium siamense TaxID=795645 RepID=A0A7W7D1Z7_9ACTN|nr:hypothetical protein [Sphaerisporangium siamense]MBB4698656.1 hypothetical protein [Sphaerisporangium siamense]GII85285.1 hypothetical protein Ssi03_32750 [Sphaerisporangium siamense]